MTTGGFSWDAHDITTPGNEDVQLTSYAILALNEVKRPMYSDNIFAASDFPRQRTASAPAAGTGTVKTTKSPAKHSGP